MSRKLLYLINPISGTGRKSGAKSIIVRKTEAAGFPYEFMESRVDGEYAFLHDKILAESITDVIACGGDGTVSRVAAALLKTDVAIGILPMGSGNGLALAAGIPHSYSKALDIIFQGYASPVDGLLINDAFSCMMCGIGADAQIAHDFAAGTQRGLKTYLRLSALQYFRLKPFSFTIRTQGQSFDTRAFFISVANSNQFGNNITIAPRASLSDGVFDIVVISKMSKLALPFFLLHQIAGGNPVQELSNFKKSKNVMYFQAAEATIWNHDDAPIHIDGEPAPAAKEIRLQILPGAFRLLQPARNP